MGVSRLNSLCQFCTHFENTSSRQCPVDGSMLQYHVHVRHVSPGARMTREQNGATGLHVRTTQPETTPPLMNMTSKGY
jgi:hypothetical protein